MSFSPTLYKFERHNLNMLEELYRIITLQKDGYVPNIIHTYFFMINGHRECPDMSYKKYDSSPILERRNYSFESLLKNWIYYLNTYTEKDAQFSIMLLFLINDCKISPLKIIKNTYYVKLILQLMSQYKLYITDADDINSDALIYILNSDTETFNTFLKIVPNLEQINIIDKIILNIDKFIYDERVITILSKYSSRELNTIKLEVFDDIYNIIHVLCTYNKHSIIRYVIDKKNIDCCVKTGKEKTIFDLLPRGTEESFRQYLITKYIS